mmetsp:Transcript_6192/g.24978  ORF Transcript_6192/g.24978 Transcript_6192/m.24978 type:complete len:325 (+) Transcript_6192:1118-2092(+)
MAAADRARGAIAAGQKPDRPGLAGAALAAVGIGDRALIVIEGQGPAPPAPGPLLLGRAGQGLARRDQRGGLGLCGRGGGQQQGQQQGRGVGHRRVPGFAVVRRFAGVAQAPNIMRRARAVFSGAARSSPARARPRRPGRPGSRQAKLRARKSVAAIIGQRSGARWRSMRASTASRPVAPVAGDSVQSRSASTRAWASRRPRFRPWPATGCRVWAALPMRSVRPCSSRGSTFRPSAKHFSAEMPVSRPATSGSCCWMTTRRWASLSPAMSSSAWGRHQTSAARGPWASGGSGSSASGPLRVKRSMAMPCRPGGASRTLPTQAFWR